MSRMRLSSPVTRLRMFPSPLPISSKSAESGTRIFERYTHIRDFAAGEISANTASVLGRSVCL